MEMLSVAVTLNLTCVMWTSVECSLVSGDVRPVKPYWPPSPGLGPGSELTVSLAFNLLYFASHVLFFSVKINGFLDLSDEGPIQSLVPLTPLHYTCFKCSVYPFDNRCSSSSSGVFCSPGSPTHGVSADASPFVGRG